MLPNKSKSPVQFFDCTVEELFQAFKDEFSGQKYRAEIIHNWVYKKGICELDQMSNLSKSLRDVLKDSLHFELPEIKEVKHSNDGSHKFIQQLSDGSEVETVVMKHEDHYSVCVSSQVGCAMGCKFCMTGTMGLKRNLKAGEIVGQVYNVYFYILALEKKIVRNIVYMGMGEPFHNYKHVTKSLHILLDQRGFNFSNRRVTVSTSGLIPQIEQYMREESTNLAISLNSPDEEKRAELMPISVKYPLEKLIETCKLSSIGLRKRITFEYIMMKGVNDSMTDAKKLAVLLKGVNAKINLIPYNMNTELNFERTEVAELKSFQQYLLNKRFIVTIRYSKGQDISAACGQLIRLKKSA